MIRRKLALAACLLLPACTNAQGAPLRSPALDYQPPPPESAADGEPIGADGVSPGEKLDQGPSTAGPAPGWSVDKGGPEYDPKKRVGGAVDPPPERGSSQK